jgi:uncharacterized protein (DUF433 family)
MTAWYDRYVEKVAGVQGGEPVITGSRTPVRTIVQMFTRAYRATWTKWEGPSRT